MFWNQWSLWSEGVVTITGIGGHHASESVVTLGRNTQPDTSNSAEISITNG